MGVKMSLKLLIENLKYFAATKINSFAYYNEFVSEEQLLKLKNTPIWYVHSQNNPVKLVDKTATPL
jgi:predicted peptidase